MAEIVKLEPIPMPALGESYQDPAFKTTVKRISDAGAHGVGWVTPEYSTIAPWNSDHSKLLLVHQDHYALYDGAGGFLRDLSIPASAEPRWSRVHSDRFYCVQGNGLFDSDDTFIEAFPRFSRISGLGESDIAFDSDRLVLCGDGHSVFTYHIQAGTKSPDLPVLDVDGLYLTPDGRLLISYRGGQGVQLYDRDMTFVRQIAPIGGHMDVTRDANGDEVLIWCNSADPRPICNNGIVKVRLADGQQTCLLSLNWNQAVHVSTPDNCGFCFVETYQSPVAEWAEYSGEILKIALDGSGIHRICHHRSVQGSYNAQPKISCSRDGSRFVFASNFGRTENPDYCDTYLVEFGEKRDRAAVEPPAEPIKETPKWRRVPRKDA